MYYSIIVYTAWNVARDLRYIGPGGDRNYHGRLTNIGIVENLIDLIDPSDTEDIYQSRLCVWPSL